MFDLKKLAEDMGALREDDVLQEIRQIVHGEPDKVPDVLQALSQGMDIVGKQFDGFEYFVGDLIFASSIFVQALEILRPVFPMTPEGQKDRVILATAEGDLHDLGKNIVKIALQARGFTVIDLGVNVAPATIVNCAKSENIHIIGLSAVLTSTVDALERTVAAFKAEGIRDQVKIIVGGSSINENVVKKIKADYYAKTPEDTVNICLALQEKAEEK